jgi:hypothetical protein
MNQNALYALIAGLFLSFAFSTTTIFGRQLSFAFQLVGGVLAIGGGAALLRDVLTHPTSGE